MGNHPFYIIYIYNIPIVVSSWGVLALPLLEISRVAVFRWEHHWSVGHLPGSHVHDDTGGYVGGLPRNGATIPQETPFVVEKNKPTVFGGSRPGLEVTLFDNTTHPVSARMVFSCKSKCRFGGHYRMSADICDQHIWDILRIFSRWRILLFLQNIHKEWGSQVTCSFFPSWQGPRPILGLYVLQGRFEVVWK